MSEDEILKILNSGFKKLTASISKGVDKILFFWNNTEKEFYNVLIKLVILRK